MHNNAEQLELSELLGRVADHDEYAFRLLYQRTRRRVHGLATRVLIDPGLAEDLTQAVYLQIWRDAGSYDPSGGSAQSWLMMITHRRAVDKVREHRGSVDAGAAIVRLLGPFSLQHEAIELAYCSGLTSGELAEHLGQPVSTVKTRIHDGLQRLKIKRNET